MQAETLISICTYTPPYMGNADSAQKRENRIELVCHHLLQYIGKARHSGFFVRAGTAAALLRFDICLQIAENSFQRGIEFLTFSVSHVDAASR